jgi:hypothetical protein
MVCRGDIGPTLEPSIAPAAYQNMGELLEFFMLQHGKYCDATKYYATMEIAILNQGIAKPDRFGIQ